MIKQTHPYLSFSGQASAAIELYKHALSAEVVSLMHWRDLPGQDIPASVADHVLHATLRVGAGTIMISDAPPDHEARSGNRTQCMVQCSEPADVDRMYARLVDGGTSEMAPQNTFWEARYAALVDRFGIRWAFNANIASPEELSLDPERDLIFERTVAVLPEQIWARWTTAELLKPWFCPKPWRVTEAEIDPRPGGIFRTVMEGPEGQCMDSTGCVLEAIPNTRLVWTDALGPGFRPTAGEAFFTGTILLDPNGEGGTRYRAIARHGTPAKAKAHADMGFHSGWGIALDQMLECIANASA